MKQLAQLAVVQGLMIALLGGENLWISWIMGPLFTTYLWGLGLGELGTRQRALAVMVAVVASGPSAVLFALQLGETATSALGYFAGVGLFGLLASWVRITPGPASSGKTLEQRSRENAHRYSRDRRGKADVITQIGLDPYSGIFGGTQGHTPLDDPWEGAAGSDHQIEIDDV